MRVKLKNLRKGDLATLGQIPIIKVSHNIIEVNSGIECVTCYVQEDRSVFVPSLTPENDVFFCPDPEKRIGGECYAETREG
jgi:hypothetical protein